MGFLLLIPLQKSEVSGGKIYFLLVKNKIYLYYAWHYKQGGNMTLLLYVNNQTLSLSPTQKNVKIVADSKNYLKVRFIF
jgi:hypothetical protein